MTDKKTGYLSVQVSRIPCLIDRQTDIYQKLQSSFAPKNILPLNLMKPKTTIIDIFHLILKKVFKIHCINHSRIRLFFIQLFMFMLEKLKQILSLLSQMSHLTLISENKRIDYNIIFVFNNYSIKKTYHKYNITRKTLFLQVNYPHLIFIILNKPQVDALKNQGHMVRQNCFCKKSSKIT